MDHPDRINACGNDVTFTGLTFCRGLDQPVAEYTSVERVAAVSGAAFVIRRKVLDEIGPFDESFFVYFEDTDLSLRALLAGHDCLVVPQAIVRHQYIFKLSPQVLLSGTEPLCGAAAVVSLADLDCTCAFAAAI